jgi:DNA helicase-2/ATP-dependent DNA helicase PcrA
MSKIQLSSVQEQIASFDSGALLVTASAGSGKTRVLTERIKRLVNKTKRKILAITFTNKASEEIRDRLQEDIDIQDRLFVGTFHSFCSSVLEKHGTAIGYAQLPQVFSDTDDRLKVVEAAIVLTPTLKVRYENMQQKDRDKFKYNALEVISKIKREVILENELDEQVDDSSVVLVYRNYNDIMSRFNAIDFDDLLYLTYRLFIENPNIAALYRRNYEYICIDEAQDLNKAQYMVLRALTGDDHNNVMLVGDPKQAIFGFTGSSSQWMNEYFKEDYHPKEISLFNNYRSARSVIEYANKLIPGASDTINIVKNGVCEIHEFDTVETEALWVCNKINNLINSSSIKDIDQPLSLENIAILARNRFILFPIEELLKKNQIQYYYKSTVRGLSFESNAGKVLNLAMQVKVNPKDSLHISQLTSILKVIDKISLAEIHEACPIGLNKKVLELVLNLKEDGSNFKTLITNLKENLKSFYSSDDTSDELNLANYDFTEIIKHWLNYAKSTPDKSIASFRNAMALGQTSQEVKNEGIVLSTVHTMKGQESEIVFLIGMDDLTFPDYRAVQNGGSEYEQEKNNLYVAITRAMRHLYITYPTKRSMPWGDVNIRKRSRLLPDL